MVLFVAFSLKKGYFLVLQISFILKKKGSVFPFMNVSERGNFLVWRTIILLHVSGRTVIVARMG